jgi:membrane fusion protein, heavy metal efflux system
MNKIALALGLIWPLYASAETTLLKLDAKQIQSLAIHTTGLQTQTQIPLLSAYAQVRAAVNREVIVTSALPGLLVEMTANVGDRVKKGQVLAHINSRDLLGLQQQYLDALNELNLAEHNYQRDRHLAEEGVVSERRWQETQALQRSKSLAAEEARQLLLVAGFSHTDIAQLNGAHHMLPQLPVHAPMDGVITERLAELGKRLDTEMALYRLADLSQMWLEIQIPQEQAQTLQIGDRVSVEGSTAQAQIKILGQQVLSSNQTIPARALVNKPAADLKVGQSRMVQISRQTEQTVYQVPNSAVVQNGDQAYVFVAQQQSYSVTPVQIVARQPQTTLIGGDLQADAQIVDQGTAALKLKWLGANEGE